MVLAPRLDPQPRRCVIRKRRAGRSRHGHYATDAHTLFNSEGESLGVEFFYAILAEVGKGPRDIQVWLAPPAPLSKIGRKSPEHTTD
jgi:hypothetical protein